MILLAALFLQATQPAKPAPKPAPKPAATEPALKAIDTTLAIETFKQVCWGAFRDPVDFHAAILDAPVPLVQQPKRDASRPGEFYKADEAALTYVASDTLPPNIPSRQCILRVRLAAAPDQLTLAARIGEALAIPNGRTRTSAAQSSTEWTIAGADGRSSRLIAATRPAAGGGTELRLTALLLAAK